MSDDRKYQQRGYQDSSREKRGPSSGPKRPVEARDPKDGANTYEKFAPRYTVERETGSTPTAPTSSRKAFDDLFKF